MSLAERLWNTGHSDTQIQTWETEAETIIADAIQFAEASPIQSPAEALTDTFS